MATEHELRHLATQFRAAIVRTEPRMRSICLEEFPHGACGDASLLLGEFLNEQGIAECEIVSGRLPGTQQTHAWLEVDGFIIDITADQFGKLPVIVTRDHTWHRRFRLVSRDAVRLDADEGVLYDDSWVTLQQAYEHIKRNLR